MQNPPTVDSKALSADSAQDWAASTQDALGHKNQTVKTDMDREYNLSSESTASTPGFPGAYPRGYSSDNVGGLTAGLGAGAAGLLQTAKDYLPQIPQTVTSYFQGPSSTNAEPVQAANMPSREAADDSLGKTDGSGALPGPPTEAAVAQLPDERWREGVGATIAPDLKPAMTSEVKGPSLPAKDGKDASSKDEKGAKGEKDAKDEQDSAAAPAPQGTSAGISAPAPEGHSPGLRAKAVAALTDEKKSESNPPTAKKDSHPTSEKGIERAESSQVSSPPSGDAPKPPDQPKANTAARTHPLAGEGVEWKGVPLDEKTQRKLDRDPKALERDEHEGTTNAIFATHQNEPNDRKDANGASAHRKTDSNVSMSSSGSPRKSRFMNKIKGEAKIISGKLGHNEQKVEEGRRLMGKI
ncbi:hypothetical protein BD626DRAFT_563232 [Schizophyllum amplum]|uniref:Uncharacterized protein n=1 Tax=Schizophyllum amplum TaxID=97359 RepID=A0A550CXH1_9AGAR|nr:hypothetical protein BD626DRAFT_563232 [Auriculariopsis ampla]